MSYNSFIVIVLLLATLPYTLGPILIFLSVRFRLPVEVVPADLERIPEARDSLVFFQRAHDALSGQGFAHVGTYCLPNSIAGAKTFLSIHANRPTGDMAMPSAIVTTGGGMPRLKAAYVEYLRRFTDKTVVQTNNANDLGSFEPVPGVTTRRFRAMADLQRLHAIHQFFADHQGRDRTPAIRLDSEYFGNALAYVAEAVLVESLEEQTRLGYWKRHPHHFRPTAKGALLMTWKELWPWKALRRRQEDRKAAQALAEFEAARRAQ